MTKDELLRRFKHSPADDLPPHLQPKIRGRELKCLLATLHRGAIAENTDAIRSVAGELAKLRATLTEENDD